MTGASTEVVVAVDRPPDDVWATITDIGSIGRWSPETVRGVWIDGAAGPEVGARFASTNRFPDGTVTRVVCRVTAADRPRTFAWDVLDDEHATEVLAHWEYDLTAGPLPGQTRIRHRFVHGPGTTDVRLRAVREPARAREIVDGRLAELNRIMTSTLAAMFAGLP